MVQRRRYVTYAELIELIEDEATLSGHDVQAVLDVLQAHGLDIGRLVKVTVEEDVP